MVKPAHPPFPLPNERWHEIAIKLNFSPKQTRVVELILRNQCDKQIEAILNMPHSTLRTHLDRIFQKASVSDRQELILLLCALSHGIGRLYG